MNKFFLAALLGGVPSVSSWTSVDDPRCHDEPNNPVIPPNPTPGPTPYPPAPTPITVYDPPTSLTPAPTMACAGFVAGFQVVDLSSGQVVDGTNLSPVGANVLKLSSLPADWSIEALTADTVTNVKFVAHGTEEGTEDLGVDDSAPFTFPFTSTFNLNVEGTYTLSAYGSSDGGATYEDANAACEVTVTVQYDNEQLCEGVIEGFSLFDTSTGKAVPGYESLDNNQVLKLQELPETLTIQAVDNGRGNGVVEFGVEGIDGVYHTEHHTPFVISGKVDGVVQVWDKLTLGKVTFWATSYDALGNAEPQDKMCQITLHVEPDYQCENWIASFALIDGPKGTPVPGYENIMGYRRIPLNRMPKILSLQAIPAPDASSIRKVRFYHNGAEFHNEGKKPYALNGDGSSGTVYYGVDFLREAGTHTIEARVQRKIDGSYVWEPRSDACSLTLTIEADVYETVQDDEHCAPEQVVPEQQGSHAFRLRPVDVVEIDVNKTVTFTVKNSIWDRKMDWITTAFVGDNGVEMCDKLENMEVDAVSEHQYEAKCFGGFAYVDIYAYSAEFTKEQADADTTFLPMACRNDVAGKVVKYTFVFSCDCENIPDVPPEVVKNPDPSYVCTGHSATSWGDPHVIPFDANSGSDHWGCQGEGEFVLSKATLEDYDYDFEMRGLYERFRDMDADNEQMTWSFTSGVVAAQDVKVQLVIAKQNSTMSNMFSNMPIDFFVDGQQRLLKDGSGDSRVIVTVDGFEVYIYFVTTGIHIRVKVRPLKTDRHSGIMTRTDTTKQWTIPGSLSVYLCLPKDNEAITNVMGLMGNPTGTVEDDFMDAMGNTLPEFTSKKSEAITNYCREHWCIGDASKSMFDHPSGQFDFDFYNYCADRTWIDPCVGKENCERRMQEVDSQAQLICNSSPNPVACLEEAILNGVTGALDALEDLVSDLKDKDKGAHAKMPSDDACWSDDFKTCVQKEGCIWDWENANSKKPNPFKAGLDCNPSGDGTVKFLINGDDREDYTCLAENADCGSGSCCDGLICDVGSTTCIAGTTAARRLESSQFVRPDLPAVRNVVPLFQSEL